MGRMSGYLVPRLVREVPGAASKVPLAYARG
jgi:L-lysine 2,3-aminomutase